MNVGDNTVKLAKSPLGLIALFVLLAEAIAGIVVTNADGLTSINQTILVCFISFFPAFVVVMFWHLVVHHNLKLYAPSEFPNHGDFLEANKISTSKALEELKVEILADINSKSDGDDAATRFSRGAVSLQTGRFITATEFLENNNLTKQDVETLRELAELREDDGADIQIVKSDKYKSFVAKLMGASAASAGGVASTAAIAEVARIIMRLL